MLPSKASLVQYCWLVVSPPKRERKVEVALEHTYIKKGMNVVAVRTVRRMSSELS